MYRVNGLEIATLACNGFGAMQKYPELAAVLDAVASGEPKIILEIGAGNGGTAWAWSKIATLQKLIVVDLLKGPWGGNAEIEKNLAMIQEQTQAKIIFINGNSQNSECKNEVEVQLEDEKLDILYIDGDHSYAGVKTDFLTYRPMVKEGGLVVFHDILEHPPETKCEVKQFWEELKASLPQDRYFEFTSEPLNWGGLGVIKL